MSMIGANAQLAPTAAPSLPQTSPSLPAMATSPVAPIDRGEPRNVPSWTMPLAPFSTFAATSMGMAIFSRSRLLSVTASSVVHGRYMMPPGVQTLSVASSAASVNPLAMPQNSWPTLAFVSRPASVVSTHAMSSSSRLNGALRMDSRTAGYCSTLMQSALCVIRPHL